MAAPNVPPGTPGGSPTPPRQPRHLWVSHFFACGKCGPVIRRFVQGTETDEAARVAWHDLCVDGQRLSRPYVDREGTLIP